MPTHLMTSVKKSNLSVIGAMNLDLSGTMGREFLVVDEDAQDYTNWSASIGGTAVNLASIASSMGITTTLVGITGRDWIGEYVQTKLLEEGNPHLHLRRISVPDSASGIVVIAYLRVEHGSIRKIIGPLDQAIDVVSVSAITQHLESLSIGGTVILDGYMFRKRQRALGPLIAFLKARDQRVCVELVPHQIWRIADNKALLDILHQTHHVSSEMSTVERLLGLSPNKDAPDEHRVENIVTLLPREPVAPTFHLRSGRREAERVTIINAGTGLRRNEIYEVPADSTLKSLGDKRFIQELFANDC
jgi:sugar/nucleoside kinase (ribokinase family)